MLDTDLRAALIRSARIHSVDPAALAAVAKIESNLTPHAIVDGRREPLIRFEGHYFDRRLAGEARDAARAAGLASPRAGAVRNPAGQAARWRLLSQARAIDAKAADESISWGVGQVMGAHWAWLGYTSVDALVAEARAGTEGQVGLMTAYIVRAGLIPALSRLDWKAFARGYNGPNYATNRYDTRLSRAHAALSRLDWSIEGSLVRGDRGPAVAALQRRLAGHGHTLAEDGIFGPATEAALRAFQSRRGLAAHGAADAATQEALNAAPPAPGLLARMGGLLRGRWP